MVQAAIAAYMLGATLYVRSLIRGSGDTRMFVVSIAWHLATPIGLIGVVIHAPHFNVRFYCAYASDHCSRITNSRIKLRPAVIGIGEYLACVLFSAVMAIVA